MAIRAFPSELNNGMYLRDYFAAHAMAGMLASLPNEFIRDATRMSLIVHNAYNMADLMLSKRDEETGNGPHK